jgi:hypothetical protein
MTKFRPLVAIGAEEPLHDRVENADYFRILPGALQYRENMANALFSDGLDGLGGIHTTVSTLS